MSPYIHELASPIGFLDILTPESKGWIESRLKTYGHKEFSEDEEKFNDLKIVEVATLPKQTAFTKAIAIDGSLASVESPSVTVLKIASVWADLTKEPIYVNGVLDPSSITKKYASEYSIGLIPGQGVFPKGKAGGWDTKLREEFYQTFRNIKTHRSSRNLNLVAFLRGILADYAAIHPLVCPNCASEKIDFSENNFETFCDSCKVDIYFTDFLSPSLFSVAGTATTPMLLAEQTLLQAIIHEVAKGNVADHNLENTLFIADGPLRLFKLQEIAELFLGNLRRFRPRPAVVSFMKSGHIESIFSSEAAEESLLPGHVAIITEEMRGSRKGAVAKQANSGLYGKSFAYRTLDGSKRFGFMLPPMMGDLHLGGAPVLDDWAAYPHLRAICDFIESNQSNENGPTAAALEIIGKANRAASLPAVLSKKTLGELVHSFL